MNISIWFIVMATVASFVNSITAEHGTGAGIVAEGRRHFQPLCQGPLQILHPQHMPFYRHIQVYHSAIGIGADVLWDLVYILFLPM